MSRDAGRADPRTGGRRGLPWTAWPIPDVLDRLACTEDGLTSEEAARRLGMVGPNRLSVNRLMPVRRLLGDQLLSAGSGLLALAVVLALLSGRRLEAGVIGGVLLANVAIGFGVQLRRRAVVGRRLGRQGPRTVVLRDGRRERIEGRDVVPGDVIEVTRGERVPADARLLVAEEVRVDEEVVSGDAAPVEKTARASEWAEGHGYRASMLYAGSVLTHGRARAVVTSTGASTAVGHRRRLGRALARRTSAIEADAASLGPGMVGIALLLSGAAIGSGLLRDRGTAWVLETGLSLAVGALPVALPAVAVIVTALALRRLGAHHVVLRHSGVLRALGSATLVCADATRTLTSAPLKATRVVSPSDRAAGRPPTHPEPAPTGTAASAPRLDPEGRRLLRAVGLTLPPRPVSGDASDPRDAALRRLVLDQGLDVAAGTWAASAPEERWHDDGGTRLRTVLHREGAGVAAYVRGSPDAVLARCAWVASPDGEGRLDPERRAAIAAEVGSLEARGMQVLAFAIQPSASRLEEVGDAMIYLGAVGIEAPPALHIAQAVSDLRDAGIRTVFLAPERAEYGAAVARNAWIPLGAGAVGQWPELPSGSSARTVDPGVLGGVPEGRSRPVLAALREAGEVVALVADDPADPSIVEEADLVIAPEGPAGEASGAHADVIVGEDGFTCVPDAVRQGRVALDNITRSIRYLVGCSLAIVMLLSLASFTGLPLPLSPLQVLWLNLVTVFLPALVLAGEPGGADVMTRPPGNPLATFIRGRALGRLSAQALSMAAFALGAFVLRDQAGSPGRGATVAFTTLALAQLLHLGNARTRDRTVGRGPDGVARGVGVSVAVVLTLQLVAVYWTPLATSLRSVPLSAPDWGVALVFAAGSALVGRMIRGRRRAPDGEGAARPAEPAVVTEDVSERPLLLQEVRLLTPAEARSLGSGFVAGAGRPFPLALAALEAGDVERLRELVGRDPELVRSRDGEGTLLHHAARISPGSETSPVGEAVSLLVRAGADPDAGQSPDGSGRTPLIEAVRVNNVPATRALLKSGADPDRGAGGEPIPATPLGHALLCGQKGTGEDCAALLLDAGCRVTLSLAAALGRVDALAEGLPGAPEEDRLRALIFAAHRGEVEAVRTCLDAGVDPSTPTAFFEDRFTPLHAAAGGGRLEVVRVLLGAGADPSVKDGRLGATASEWAQRTGHDAVVSLLVEASRSRI